MAGDIPDVYLRFDGFTGECNDLNHQGEDGWITVKSFSFGFGFQGSDGTVDEDDDPGPVALTPASGNGKPGQTVPPKPRRKRRSEPLKSGPMTFDCISFSKASDCMSASLMDACHRGELISTVELHACRYGGGPNNEKVPFLHLVFSNVHLKTCKLNLATEGMPGEDIEFEYEKVEMKCMWTDNATGKPLDEQPIGAGWDLVGQKELEEGDDDDDDGG